MKSGFFIFGNCIGDRPFKIVSIYRKIQRLLIYRNILSLTLRQLFTPINKHSCLR
jgi:hypothetical protein